MQRLINDLLELSRISAKQNKFHSVDLNVILAHVLEDLELLIESKQAKIHVEKLPVILGDETQLRQLFQNLISNSIKFKSEERSPEIFISAEFLKSPHQDFLEINFKDNGIGIDEKYSEKYIRFFKNYMAINMKDQGLD
jgi:light-regulated signal transduction histidine kinase (bacteriophytochrome)